MPQPDLPFPEPVVIAGRNFWPLGAVRDWRDAVVGRPPRPAQPDDEKLISARQVRELFGGVSDMWLYRRRRTKQPALESAAAGAST
jgi:hypothetical protein